MMTSDWYLVGDIGGTHARFAVTGPAFDDLKMQQIINTSAFTTFDDALNAYLQDNGLSAPAKGCCLAVAGVSGGSVINMTNRHWTISLESIRSRLGSDEIHAINDFAALAWTLPDLKTGEWRQTGGGEPVAGKPCAVVGPGTGLGVGTVAFIGDDYVVLDGQGGHVSFAPETDLEIDILKRLRARFGRVSAERLLSGQGLVNIYAALADIEGMPADLVSADQITAATENDPDGLAATTVSVFFAVLGSVAGDIALVTGALGGIYLGGGVVGHLSGRLEASEFRSRFEAKGRYAAYNRRIPTRVILRESPGLSGAAIYLKKAISTTGSRGQ